jgi:hypothetical protein
LAKTIIHHAAAHYPSTDGIILSSDVRVESNDETAGSVYGVDTSYSYSVAGHSYTNPRYRYDTSTSSDVVVAKETVGGLSSGAKVAVFYDPANPQNSTLMTGITGSDLFHLAFMTPFNGVMIAFCWVWFARWRLIRFKPEAGGARIITEPGTIRVRLTRFPSLAVALATISLLAFLCLFLVGIPAALWNFPLETMEFTWAFILLAGLLAGGWQWLRAISGRYDLVINTHLAWLDLPLSHNRKVRQRIPFKNVQNVRVETIIKPSKSDEQDTPTYAPTLDLIDAEPPSARLVEYWDQDRAETFATWLRAKLSLPSSEPP